jgi:hypothetical protein
MSTTSTTPAGSTGLKATLKGITAKLLAAARDFKAEVLKAAAAAPAIAADVAKDAPEVADVVELVFPGSAAIEAAGLAVFDAVVDAVEAAGPAASANGMTVPLDKTLIASIQNVLPALKALAAKL